MMLRCPGCKRYTQRDCWYCKMQRDMRRTPPPAEDEEDEE